MQKVCRLARDEAQVGETLDAFWERPGEAGGVLVELGRRNQNLFRFEKMLEKY